MMDRPLIDLAQLASAVVDAAKAEILADVRAGVVPDTLRSFCDLHDYVDANFYGFAALGRSVDAEVIAVMGAAQDQLEEWIAGGGLRLRLAFCDICDRPYPAAMLCESICATCWTDHASDLCDPDDRDWATGNAAAARGPLLLAGEVR